MAERDDSLMESLTAMLGELAKPNSTGPSLSDLSALVERVQQFASEVKADEAASGHPPYRPENAEALRDLVIAAFDDTVYPGDEQFAGPERRDSETAFTYDFFRGRRWREIAEVGEKLPTGYGGMSFLTDEAWRYYLPSYLLVGVGDADYGYDAASSALFQLLPPEDFRADLNAIGHPLGQHIVTLLERISPPLGARAEDFRKRTTGFTPEQEACIAAYAASFRDFEPGNETSEATASYWAARVAAGNDN